MVKRWESWEPKELLKEVMRKYFCYRQEGRRKYIFPLIFIKQKVTFHTRERKFVN